MLVHSANSLVEIEFGLSALFVEHLISNSSSTSSSSLTTRSLHQLLLYSGFASSTSPSAQNSNPTHQEPYSPSPSPTLSSPSPILPTAKRRPTRAEQWRRKSCCPSAARLIDSHSFELFRCGWSGGLRDILVETLADMRGFTEWLYRWWTSLLCS